MTTAPGIFFCFFLAWQERKKLLGPPPLDHAPPKPTWPSRVVQRRPAQTQTNLQAWLPAVPQPPET